MPVYVSIPHRYGKNRAVISSENWTALWFPFLIGTVRTKHYQLQLASVVGFPFLIGTVRTYTSTLRLRSRMVVSIPHRYGKNAKSLPRDRILGSFVSIPHRYGKNSAKNLRKLAIFFKFPFLIGTVRTGILLSKYRYFIWVSIPHRYGKNFDKHNKTLQEFEVSIPHRYGKNRHIRIVCAFWRAVSIPHRYGKNPQTRLWCCKRNSVSIPHRYGKNVT